MIVVRYTWHVDANFAEVRKLFMEITMPEVSALRGGVAIRQRPGWTGRSLWSGSSTAWLIGKSSCRSSGAIRRTPTSSIGGMSSRTRQRPLKCGSCSGRARSVLSPALTFEVSKTSKVSVSRCHEPPLDRLPRLPQRDQRLQQLGDAIRPRPRLADQRHCAVRDHP